MQPPVGLYIHLPFCAQKCFYCDFYSLPPKPQILLAYAEALVIAARPFTGLEIDTIYLGGGTPTLAGADWLCSLLKQLRSVFRVLPESEISLEANPETVNPDLLKALRLSGYNRVSFGLQTTEDKTLSLLGRRHDAQQGIRAVQWAADAGFENISADLMLGLPGQESSAAVHSVRQIASLPLRHISAYLLKIEDDTPFGRRKETLCLPDDEETASLYEQAITTLKEAGYPQYEISNFAKSGFSCRHNLKYWHLQEYLGLGPSAHSFLNGRRFYYPRSLKGFLADPCDRTDDGPGGSREEYIAMSLRLTEGMNWNEYRMHYGGEHTKAIKSMARMWQDAGFCRVNQDRLALTPKGFLVSNSIISEILRIDG